MSEPAPSNLGSTFVGCILGFGLSVMLIMVLLFAQSRILFLFGGLIQLVYVVPLVIHFRKRGQRNIATGIIISAALFLLLSTACASMLQ